MQGVESGTDRWAVQNGYISITPLRLDLTDEVLLRALRQDAHRRAEANASGVPGA